MVAPAPVPVKPRASGLDRAVFPGKRRQNKKTRRSVAPGFFQLWYDAAWPRRGGQRSPG
jgi:hypothetical protein